MDFESGDGEEIIAQAVPFQKWEFSLQDKDECRLFVQYLLSDLALRGPSRHRHPKNTSQDGIYINRQGDILGRGSDRAERIYISIVALRSVGESINHACVRVAELLEDELGESRRGRPSPQARSRDLASKRDTVRSIFSRYRSKERIARFSADVNFRVFLSSFRTWRQWVLNRDDFTFDFLTEKFRNERGPVAAKKFRAAIEAARKKYAGSTDPRLYLPYRIF